MGTISIDEYIEKMSSYGFTEIQKATLYLDRETWYTCSAYNLNFCYKVEQRIVEVGGPVPKDIKIDSSIRRIPNESVKFLDDFYRLGYEVKLEISTSESLSSFLSQLDQYYKNIGYSNSTSDSIKQHKHLPS